jgi:hypothetical protein
LLLLVVSGVLSLWICFLANWSLTNCCFSCRFFFCKRPVTNLS